MSVPCLVAISLVPHADYVCPVRVSPAPAHQVCRDLTQAVNGRNDGRGDKFTHSHASARIQSSQEAGFKLFVLRGDSELMEHKLTCANSA
jgi:hypothetical protein